MQSPITASPVEFSRRAPRPSALFKRYSMPEHSRSQCGAHRAFAAQALRAAVHILIDAGAAAIHGPSHTKSGRRPQ